MPPLRLLPTAELEFADAAIWYERRRAGLGRRFVSAVEETFERILRRPDRFETPYRDLQRAPVADFPYGVYFRQEGDCVLIVAVFHLHRDPQQLRRRMD